MAPGRRPRVSCALLLPLLVLSFGACARTEAPLQPVHRLFQELEPPLDQIPLHCDVDDVFRPTIGCVSFVPLPAAQLPRPAGRVLAYPYTLPEGIAPELIAIEPKVRGPRQEWRRTAPMLLATPADGRGELMVPLPEQAKGEPLDVQAHVRPIPPNHQERVTRPLRIGRGAVLSVALGLEQFATRLGASPVEFRLTVERVGGEATDLIREILDPRTAKTWQEHEIDLAAFSGATVRFRFVTDVVGRAGVPGPIFGVPLWGSAQVLEPRPRDTRRNVVLISLDTMRGDQLGGTLDGKPLMPALDARAGDGARFTAAYTTYPSTTAGHMSMLTGLYPAEHGMTFATGHLSPTITTLTEILAANGYATAAVTENAMLSAYVGFVRGFDVYREIKGKTLWETAGEIEQTFGAGLEWLERHRDEQFFLFLHTYQVHTPYTPPSGYDLFPVDPSMPPGERDRRLYAGEVRYTDEVLDRLLRRLGELDLLDDTIVVITSDHGDEFMEHGLIGHAKTAFDEVLHVPLVILAPRLVPAGRTIDVPVSLVDVVPTLLDLLRLPAPRGLHGQSLVPLLHGGEFPPMRVLYAESPPFGARTGHRVAARAAGFKWVGSDHPEVGMKVYDLTRDPAEQHPLDDPALIEIGRHFEGAYRAVEKRPSEVPKPAASPQAAKKPELDDATLEKLKALGYMD